MEPKWLIEARKYLGQAEVPGAQSNPWILGLWVTIPWIWSTVTRRDDTLLPWCGAFLRLCLVQAGITPPRNWFRAREYLNFGTNIGYPCVGAIGVMQNGRQWHVGFVVGRDNAGNIIMLGGNQNNSVRLSAFKPSLFKAYRWPTQTYASIPLAGNLPILSAAISASEY